VSLYVSKGFIEKDGVQAVTSTKLDLKQASNSDDVDTILEDGLGFAQGTVRYVVDIENPVPARGFEVDWFAAAARGRLHTLRFVLLNPEGGVAYSILLRGVFRDPQLGVGANKAATNGVQFHGVEVPG
jgi:hypothetical protein